MRSNALNQEHINSRVKWIFVLLCILFAGHSSVAQVVYGHVTDSITGKPMPFVNVIYNDEGQGCITDLDGNFKIEKASSIDYLQFSFIGYDTYRLEKKQIQTGNALFVPMKKKTFVLEEVTVLPGVNPAHRIINMAVANKSVNNPKELDSYAYTSYSKIYFSFDEEPFQRKLASIPDTIEKDSTGLGKTLNMLEKQHFFMMESVTRKQFEYPDKEKEEILASRVSGLKKPFFTFLAEQFQSFSFYGDKISLLGESYISPLTKGATKRYFFLIRDSLYTPQGDTVFMISYRPHKNSNFKGLHGLLYINSSSYAVQNVTAAPKDTSAMFHVEIRQKYRRVDSLHWFPDQLITRLRFETVRAEEDSVSSPMIGVGKTYIKEVSVNTDFEEKIRGGTHVVYADGALKRDSAYWKRFRTDTLSDKESTTYRVIDSIGEVHKFDQKLQSVEILVDGKIPWKFLSFDINRLLWYNKYEGTRLGMGVETNHRLLPFLSPGGYAAYGFEDRRWKYGAYLDITPWKSDLIELHAAWCRDNKERDAYRFEKISLLSEASYSQLFIKEMDFYENYEIKLGSNYFRGLEMELRAEQMRRLDGYSLDYHNTDSTSFFQQFETGVYLRFAPKERFIRTPSGKKMSMGTPYPVVHLNFRQGIPQVDGVPYSRLECQIHDVLPSKWAGDF